MNALQIMAIRRIKYLVESMNPTMTAYALRERTKEEALAEDKKSSVQWLADNSAQLEAVAWTQALLDSLGEP